MAIRFILLVLPALGLADIHVFLLGALKSKTYPNVELGISKLSISGEDVGIITNTERNIFNLSDNNLKDAVNSWFGKRPDNVYLSSPTPGEDLYQSLGWCQVTRTLRPILIKNVNVSSEPAVIRSQVLRNNNVMLTTFPVNISIEVQNRVSSSWNTVKELSVEKNISYGIKTEFGDIFNRDISFYYTSPWGNNYQQTQNTTLGASSYVGVHLEPGQSAISQMIATKHAIQFEVEYEASFGGRIAATYDNEYKGQRNWSFDIIDCMNNIGVSYKFIAQEIIDFEFYADTRINVYDPKNGTVLLEAVHWFK